MTPVNSMINSLDNYAIKHGESENGASAVNQTASRQFPPYTLYIKRDSLQGNRTVHLNDVSKLTPEVKKTKSIGARIFSWAINGKISVWASANIYKSIRYWMLLGAPSQKTKNQIDKILNELTGSIHLARAIHALSPAVAAWIREKLISLKTHESISVFFKGEQSSLETFIDGLLKVMYMNISKKILRGANETEAKQKTVSLADTISLISELINRHLQAINDQLETIEITPEGEERNKLICDVFSSLIEEFLAIALPNNVDELPLTKVPILSRHYWNVFKKNVLPIFFYDSYLQLVAPMRESQKETLLHEQSGGPLASLAKMGGEAASELFPKILAESITVEGSDDRFVQEHSVIAAITNCFGSFLYGSELMKNWLSGWFIKELVGIGKSKDVHLIRLWKLLGGYVEPMLIHIFINLSQIQALPESANGRKPKVLEIIFIRLLSICSRFFNDHDQRIQRRVDQLQCNGEDFKEDFVLLEIFTELADDLLGSMGLNDKGAESFPLPEFLKPAVLQLLKEMAPAFLLRQYIAISKSTIDDKSSRIKFRSALFDHSQLKEPAVAIKVVSALHMSKLAGINMTEEFYRRLWEESGTENAAKALEEMCELVASTLINSVMDRFGISNQIFLNPVDNLFMRNFNGWIKSLVETAVLESLVHIIETIEEKEQPVNSHSKSLVPANTLIQLYSILEKRLKGITKELVKIAELHPQDSEAYRLEANKLFVGLALDFDRFCGIYPFRFLPLDEFLPGEAIKKNLWTGIQKIILPDIVRTVFFELTKWQASISDSYDELEKTYHTSHPKWACKILAQYSIDFIRHYLRCHSDNAAKELLSGIKSCLNPEMGIEEDVEALISQNLQVLAEHQSPQLASLRPALISYLEAIFAKFFAGLSKTIQKIELENPDFMVDIAIQILKETANHFSVVTSAAEQAGVEQAFEVPLEDMLSAFGGDLHDAIPLDPADSEEAKDLTRLKGCFIPLASKLLRLANLSLEDFPIPSVIRHQAGNLLVNKILPLTLLRFYQKAFEPQVRNGLMLNFIQTLYAALNGSEEQKKGGGLKEASVLKDPKQKHLYETCGSLVLELIKLIPDTAVQYVFMKEKVTHMSAEAIGGALMPYLSRWTLLQMIDAVIYNVLPALHPAKWEGKFGREDLVPRKAFVRPDGNMELRPVKDFKFDFPSTLAKINSLEEAKIEDASEVRRELRNGFTKMISQQLYAKVWDFVKSLWKSLQDHLNDFIENRFPEKGLEVKAVLDEVCGKIFIEVLGSIVLFLATPLASLVKFIIEKTVIDSRSEDVIENLQSEVMENLFYKWNDTIIDSLIRLQKKEAQ